MRVKLLLGALLICGLLTVPASACGGSGLFGGGGLFNGGRCGLFSGKIVSRIRARRAARISNRIERLEGERSILLDGKRPRAVRRNCEDGTCDVTPAPEIEDGAMLEVHSPGILDGIVNLDVRIPSPSSILNSVGLGVVVE